MTRILKTIYIQNVLNKGKQKKTIEEILKGFNYDKDIFNGIKFEYIYLPSINPNDLEEGQDLLEIPAYRNNFDIILNILTKTKNFNCVASRMDYINTFNEAINGNFGFNSQTILKDLELDFNGIYSRYENKIKNELSQKIPNLKKLENLNETFEQFIQKQNLDFTFEIKNEEYTFYGN